MQRDMRNICFFSLNRVVVCMKIPNDVVSDGLLHVVQIMLNL
jgi:hypothetical protein